MCLFSSEIKWMENFEEKMGRKTFLESIWLGEKEGKQIVEPDCFLPGPTKKFSLQNGEKTEERNWASFLDKHAHVQIAHGPHPHCFFFLDVILFYFILFIYFFYGHDFFFYNKFR